MQRATAMRTACLTLVICALVACGSTHIQSARAPNRPAAIYQRLLVVFSLQDLRERERTEAAFVNEATGSGTEFLSATSVIPLQTRHTAQMLRETFGAHGIDAILVLLRSDDPLLGGRALDPVQVRERLAGTDFLTVFDAATGGTVVAPSDRAAGATGQSLPVGDPWVRYTAVLYDASSTSVVWTAATSAEGMLKMPGDLFRSIARKTVEQLRLDAMINPDDSE